MREIEVPVLVVGGGPVGLTLAADLAWRGQRCMLVEQRTEPTDHPKATLLGSRSMEHFRHWHLDQPIFDAGLPQEHTYYIVFATRLCGHELHRFASPSVAEVRGASEAARLAMEHHLHESGVAAADGPARTPRIAQEGAQVSIQRFDVGARMSEMAVHNGVIYLAGQVAAGVDHGIPLPMRQRRQVGPAVAHPLFHAVGQGTGPAAVEDRHGVATRQRLGHQVPAQEAAAADHEQPHVGTTAARGFLVPGPPRTRHHSQPAMARLSAFQAMPLKNAAS